MSPVPYPYTVECFGPLDGGGSRYLVRSFPTQEALLEALPEIVNTFGPWTRILCTTGHGQKEESHAG
jgi:hypothetical protein